MTRDERLLCEFMPAALEVESAPPPRFARAVLWAILLLLIIAISWACVSKIDIVASAQGQLQPNGKVKVIQPLQSSLIKSIHVKEGQFVREGEHLITLDASIQKVQKSKIKNEIDATQIDIENSKFLIAYAEGNEPALENENNNLSPQLLSMLNDYQARLTEFDSNITSLKAEQEVARVNVNRYLRTLSIVSQRAESLEELSNKGLVPKDDYLQIEQKRVEHEEALTHEKARIHQIQTQIYAVEKQLLSYRKQYLANQYSQLTQFKRQLKGLADDYRQTEIASNQQVLLAPIDGVVEAININTIGGVVTPAQELMKLVPKGQTLVVSAGLLNKDIGFVMEGQRAEVKLEAFPFMRYGVLNGVIENVSVDAMKDERLGLLFPIKVKLEKDEIHANGKVVKLQSGMQATVEIKTGERRIIEYLLAPIIRGVYEGARER